MKELADRIQKLERQISAHENKMLEAERNNQEMLERIVSMLGEHIASNIDLSPLYSPFEFIQGSLSRIEAKASQILEIQRTSQSQNTTGGGEKT